ncbi:PAS domain S-box protein [Flammeovirga sp. SubArs3]|uniref:PAS domain S-box protein n=1 Tax=Flammeovirga sp. SubArs3 TaxID=2995316 RepID=UPI00248B5D40|nr:PAS domain S-box protein [Flammeovirga sp. SubArs3]
MQAFLQNRHLSNSHSQNSPEHYLVISEKGNVKFISKDFLKGLHTFEEGRSIAVGLSPKNQIVFKQKIQESIEHQDITEFEFTISQNSRANIYEVKLIPFFLDQVYVNAIFVLKNIKNELEAKRFRDTYFHSVDGIVWVDPFDKKVIYSNPAFSKITGYTENENNTFTFHKFIPYHLQGHASEIFSQLRREKHLIIETVMQTKSGNLLPVQITASIVSSEDDTPYIVCFVKDLTTLTQVQEKLKNNEQRYGAILDNSRIKLCQFDVNFKLTWIGSGSSKQPSKFLAPSHVGKSIHNIIKTEAGKEITKFLQDTLNKQQTSHTSFQIQYDSEWKAVELFLSPIIEDNKVIGLNAVFLNISDQKKIEEKLDHFIYRAAHDLRGPLTTIQGIIQLMKADIKDHKNMLRLMEDTVWTQDMHLQKILAYYYNQQSDLNIEVVDFDTIINGLYNFVENSGYNINVTVANGLKKEVYQSDKNRIDLLFKNICTTILQLVSRDIEIKLLIEIKKTDNGVYLAFIDNVSPRNPTASNNGFDKSHSLNFAHDDYSRGIFITSEIVEKLKGKYQVNVLKNNKQRLEITLPHLK